MQSKNYKNINLINKPCFYRTNCEHFKKNFLDKNSLECTSTSTIISFELDNNKFGVDINKKITIKNCLNSDSDKFDLCSYSTISLFRDDISSIASNLSN